MKNDPLARISTRTTPQMERTPGRTDEVRNNAGGYVFAVDKWQQALRFLILGTTGGTYYVSEQKLTQENANLILSIANGEDGKDLVDLIRTVSTKGRAPRQNPTLFALAACAASTNPRTREAALAAIPEVCRTGTMLFQFANYVQQFRGWGRGLRNAVGSWYLDKSNDSLAYQAIKYRQRTGWSHRDLLRLAHPLSTDETKNELFRWIVDGEGASLPRIVQGYELAQKATIKDVPRLVEEFGLPWEALPDAALNLPETWEALLPTMGITALVRNLGRLSKLGVIAPMSAGTKEAVNRLTDADQIAKSRIHPVQILFAISTYGAGHGFRGSMSWTVVPQINDALDAAFNLAFGNIVPANKRTLVALDVSASMGFTSIYNSNLTPRDAAAALAVPIVRTEPEYHTMAFTSTLQQFPIGKSESVRDVVKRMQHMPFGGTDCALPMVWAMQHRVPVDTFVVITDSETWAGRVKPYQALQQYRDKLGIPARLAVIAATSSGFSIADPTDAGMMDFVGFDTSTPTLLNDFSREDI